MALFFELIQVAMGRRTCLSRQPSDKEWQELFALCKKQSIATFVFTAFDALDKAGQKPPVGILYEWIGLSEQMKAQNALMDQEAARLTQLFEQEGHRTAILKGQANARLYPEPWSRQPGDIDIWVDGGREKVISTAKRLGLFSGEISEFTCDGHANISYHHLHLLPNEHGIPVEVHFRPSSGNKNPFTNRRLQAFLEKEIRKENSLVPEGFRVPGMAFALVMQLAHIQRHLVSEGVGMRQVLDYYYLLKHSRISLVSTSMLKSMGVYHMAGALMWVLHEVLGLEEHFLIAQMDRKRGQMLLQAIMEGGNFGRYRLAKAKSLSQRILAKHQHRVEMLRFDFCEAFFIELYYVSFFFRTIPERISRRKWSLE